jgi:hypothetical protein
MKNNIAITCAFLLALCSYSIAQGTSEKSKPTFSCGIFYLYPHYFLEYETQFNFGFGGVVSENFKPFSISTGLFYATKKYFEPFEGSDDIDKISYSINYYNIPVLIGFPLNKHEVKKNYFLIEGGVIFNIPRNYQSFIYYNNDNSTMTNATPDGYSAGSSFRLAFQYHRKLNNAFNLFSGVYTEYKFKLDYISFNSSQPQWHSSYSEDRFLAGINIGVEWIYTRK